MRTYNLRGDPIKVFDDTGGGWSRVLGIKGQGAIKVVDRAALDLAKQILDAADLKVKFLIENMAVSAAEKHIQRERWGKQVEEFRAKL